jgi:hypothetical protein
MARTRFLSPNVPAAHLKTPQTPAFLHASENMFVSGPGMVVAVAMHSSLSYLRTRHDQRSDMSGIHLGCKAHGEIPLVRPAQEIEGRFEGHPDFNL